MKRIIPSLTLVIGIVIGSANATLIPMDYLNKDDGLITFDTTTDLGWLDISETQGSSVNQIIDGYGDYLDNGFRYATTAEVKTLFTNNNLIITGYGQTTTNGYDDMVSLMTLLGGENDSGFSHTIHALTSNTNSLGRHDSIYLGYYYSRNYGNDNGDYWINANYNPTPPDRTHDDLGSFLIMDNIPEPSSVSLLVCSITSLMILRKRIKC